ncbi:MAG TPA: hypothetical protein VFV41_21040 [Streptosporangiaceae bacterium]|nr:hypothetical protein [Streptosporangiaceae bacterium]
MGGPALIGCSRRRATWARTSRAGQSGYAQVATETPQPAASVLGAPLAAGGRTCAPGEIIYPGFGAETLSR